MNKERFKKAISETSNDSGVGTLGEKTLHSTIKRYLQPNEEYREVKIGRLVADIFDGENITEIQTRNFLALKKKLPRLTEVAPVRIVLPLPYLKWVCWIDNETGETSKKRKSPKCGRPHDGLYEISKIKEFLKDSRVSLSILMINMEEYRNLDGWGNGGKRGSSRHERIPLELVEEYNFSTPEDYKIFIPDGLGEEFTLKEFEKASKLNRNRARGGLDILRSLGLVEKVGTRGRENLYQLATSPMTKSNTSIVQKPASIK